MFRVKKLALPAVFIATALTAFAAESHGVAPAAEALFNVGPLPVTNSMVTSWIVAAVLIIAIRLAIKKPQLVPSRAQAMVENLVEGILDLTSPIVGKKVAKHTFPLLVALFTFILIQNWSGLFPGVGTIFMVDHASGEWMEFIRPGNADMNGTIALAVVSFIGWLYFILRYAGPKLVLKDIFGNKADKREVPAIIYYPLFGLFFAVGLIEIVSILFRPISLSFRLFGNVFGGENLLHSMSAITPWVLPVPFYFLELLIGFVQALVFTLLVSVYIGLICNHGDDHEADHGHGEAGKAAH
ncbi:MAG: F-type H+-transporting ATPase subunit a [Verrucomicrobia bacterium]|jgi:F-type H+-transporting ATPase subunit a|nr:MAG: F-type H+-transporting ATPase subunit a [Verrucomicrobiota bacterium]